ncbi:ECF-type sigma factor [Rudaea sp.]|uniref:ECF-type sigma factor n=1 Tax=Rudaea sp. TaxID=2136325 RepID=UPI0039E353E7
MRLAQVIECRYFAGYGDAETALALGVSERSVRRDWTLARAWLTRELAGGSSEFPALFSRERALGLTPDSVRSREEAGL